MNQYHSIKEIRNLLKELLNTPGSETIANQLMSIDQKLSAFHDNGIDFKEVVDAIDESILITDKDGVVLYTNPSYERNTSISPKTIIGKSVFDLINKDKLYSGGAVPSVLKEKRTVYRMSTTYANEKPLKGFVIGTPLFDENGDLHQVIAISSPIVSLKALQSDFNSFLTELNNVKIPGINTSSQDSLSPRMIGRDTSLKHIWDRISKVATSDATVLITGETGSGKEVIADEIYRNSLRNDKPYIKINCASIPANLLESELFGYEKGAFSGANVKGKPGLFELANHGTLLLDEIGDMPMDLQAKLLRAIQSRTITRIGGINPISLDVRFIASTNCNLKEKIANGSFRQDLFYRLNVIPINVPPLRKRTEDFEEFCQYFLNRFSRKYGQPLNLTESHIQILKSHDWPGNIRELENIIEYLVLCSAGTDFCDESILLNLIQGENAPNPIEKEEPAIVTNTEPQISFENLDFQEAVGQFEKKLLENALSTCKSLRDAGDLLGLNASTISRKIKQYNIDYPHRK